MNIKEIIIACVALLVCVAGFVATSSSNVEYPRVDYLEQARQATFLVGIDEEGSGGTAILVGRHKLDDGRYRYNAMTANHVMDDLADKIRENLQKPEEERVEIDRTLSLIFQPSFHGEPVRYSVQLLDDPYWSVPPSDWAAFAFILDARLTCATVATKEDFLRIKPFEKLYAIGCDDGDSLLCRTAVMGSTNNEHRNREDQLIDGMAPWDKKPYSFFRISMPIWYGASGGPVLNAEGKLIGLINGSNASLPFSGLVSHTAIITKVHVILESQQIDLLTVED